jgi:O-antigen ligase
MKKLFNLENLIYLTIFALPCYLVRFSLFGFPTNALDVLISACLFSGWVLYRKKINYLVFFKNYRPFIFSAGLIFGGLLSSSLVAGNYGAGFGVIKSWFLLPILFSLVAGLAIEKEKRRNILFAYYASAFFVALSAWGYFIFQVMTYDGRLQGFFNSPNYLAMYLAPAIFVFYGLFIEAKIKRKWLFGLSGIVILGALYMTYSYAGWLATLGAVVLALGIEKKLSWKTWLIGVLLSGALFFSQTGMDKFQGIINLDERASFSSRIMIWRSAEKMLENSWLWGIGAGNFQVKYLEYQKYFPPYLEWAVPHPHNLYLTFWLYGGIFGLAGFLALIGFWFRKIFRTQKNPTLKFIGLGIMLYFLLHGLVDTTYFKNDLATLFWLLFVLL